MNAILGASTVAIPAGWGVMGTDGGRPDEQPSRSVYLDGFRLDRYEVTNLQYAGFVEATRERPPRYWRDGSYADGTAAWPVVGVSWKQASAYCAWVGKRLPTEAEWERACRGTEGRIYPWGDEWQPANTNVAVVPLADPDDAWAWLAGTEPAPATPAPVGEPLGGESPYGVSNLAGNASEWVADWYDSRAYATLADENPVGAGPEWNHSIRGGAWLMRHGDENLMVERSRCAFRNSSHSADDPRVGFRCAAAG